MTKDSQPTTVSASMRMERIERLLYELQYEVTRGVMEREIDETIMFRFMISNSRRIPGGIVFCEFRTRPFSRYEAAVFGSEPLKLKLVKGGGDL